MKFPVADLDALERTLAAHGARPLDDLHEEDHYFNAPDRDFGRTDEALRLRRIGEDNYVTYKGPRRDAQTKTRTEIEVSLAAGAEAAAQFTQVLTHLGYRPTAVVRKDRRRYLLEDVEGFRMEACLDTVQDVGTYAELEVLAPEERLPAARDAVLRTAARFGLSGSERRSYLELLLTRRHQAS